MTLTKGGGVDKKDKRILIITCKKMFIKGSLGGRG